MNLLRAFADKFFPTGKVSLVTCNDTKILEKQGNRLEDLLDFFVLENNWLLHGSRTEIKENILKPNEQGIIYATDSPFIAMLKALLSNKNLRHPGLSYPLDNKSVKEVKIYGIKPDTVRIKGFIYLIPDRTGFKQKKRMLIFPTCEYCKQSSYPTQYTGRIEVAISQFKYPIFDIDHKRRVK